MSTHPEAAREYACSWWPRVCSRAHPAPCARPRVLRRVAGGQPAPHCPVQQCSSGLVGQPHEPAAVHGAARGRRPRAQHPRRRQLRGSLCVPAGDAAAARERHVRACVRACDDGSVWLWPMGVCRLLLGGLFSVRATVPPMTGRGWGCCALRLVSQVPHHVRGLPGVRADGARVEREPRPGTEVRGCRSAGW